MAKKDLVQTRLDSTQRAKLDDLKKAAGIKTDSRFVREIIEHLDKNMMVLSGDKDREIFSDINLALNKIGTNVNQIAHFLNLEHLKGMGNFKSIEDLFVIDKLKEIQMEVLKKDLEKLSDVLDKMKKMLEGVYGMR